MEGQSIWSQALSTYRDVEVAKRNQPKLVQGIQQVQTPLARNLNAPIIGTGSNAAPLSSSMIPMVLGVLAVGGALFYLMNRRR